MSVAVVIGCGFPKFLDWLAPIALRRVRPAARPHGRQTRHPRSHGTAIVPQRAAHRLRSECRRIGAVLPSALTPQPHRVVLKCPAHEIGATSQFKLAQDIADHVPGGELADDQRFCYLLVGLPLGHQEQYLLLPRGQLLHLSLSLPDDQAGEPFCHNLCYGGVKDGLTASYRSESFQ